MQEHEQLESLRSSLTHEELATMLLLRQSLETVRGYGSNGRITLDISGGRVNSIELSLRRSIRR